MPTVPYTTIEKTLICALALVSVLSIAGLVQDTSVEGDLAVNGGIQATGSIASGGNLVRTFGTPGFTGNCTISGLTRIELWNGTVVNCV